MSLSLSLCFAPLSLGLRSLQNAVREGSSGLLEVHCFESEQFVAPRLKLRSRQPDIHPPQSIAQLRRIEAVAAVTVDDREQVGGLAKDVAEEPPPSPQLLGDDPEHLRKANIDDQTLLR